MEEPSQKESISSLVEEQVLQKESLPDVSDQKESISSIVEDVDSNREPSPDVSDQKEYISSIVEDEGEDSDNESSGANSLMYMAEEEEEETKGGAHKLDGMLLKEGTNNIFLSKLKKREPTLFLSEDTGNFSAYSKICPANRSRQPIILTPKEKEDIDAADNKNGSKSYNHALEYGTDPENKNFYI